VLCTPLGFAREITLKNNKLYYHNNEINTDDLILAEKCRLRINTYDNDINNYNSVTKIIHDKYPLVTIKHNKLLTITSDENNIITDNNDDNITIDDIINDELEKLNTDIKDQVKTILLNELKDAINNIEEKHNWKLLSLNFSNLLTFGPNNSVDFTNLIFDGCKAPRRTASVK